MAYPRKRFGQHWLRSEQVLHRILEAAAVSRCDRILEIGPGQGILTRWLLSLADTVIAVEIDWDLCRSLQNQFHQADNLVLLQGDFLELDLSQALARYPDTQWPNKVVANIPYYITGPILERLLGTMAQPAPHPYDSIVLLLQRDVAERLYASPGSKTFGALSVRVQYLAQCELICPVPPQAFQPPPKVDSAVVRLTPRPQPWVVKDPQKLQQWVTLGFANKRKMLRNNLKGVIDRDHLMAVMEQLGLDPKARAEDLSVEQWVALSNQTLTPEPEPETKG
ncbi:Ribosomal RNA small subunit methyltransferase A [Halomicronema hongdechloris C2206]|uniref:Ribosomal RNA small subunit methyltransferase A n=1 Tax=Halomicronema hongdechloris C2206 TaxID=1641165 RepID=A0A1Z3HUD1_9CYAN|nr:16S rRNA (adenine(1518)-N(6)/adenine(1519)-N(6))-dimethyltransferase RsmA [Halomicronema hongdechloris]ASC73886.1 Ribosomal RNA small subunit methyltransferase A [Halomicronema hongdechloris C2206]